tara:strand:+ start:3310 stop:3984 length:675 start_codon:yes stop_codon:yes gene_type:complete
MKLSENTISVLKNFATINQNLLIREGNTLTTMSAMKNIVAQAEVEETFPKEIAIYDLNEFLSSLSLFSNPLLQFGENSVLIVEENNNYNALKYFYSDPSVVTTPSKSITMPETEVSFNLKSSDLTKLKRAAGVIGAPDMSLTQQGQDVMLSVCDKKNDTANTYSLDVDTNGTNSDNYRFYFKVENLKLIDGDYTVAVSSKNISHFKNGQVEYWIALEPDSTYEA